MSETPLVATDTDFPRASARIQLIHAIRHYEPGEHVTRRQLESHLPEDSWLLDLDRQQRTLELSSRVAYLAGSRARRNRTPSEPNAPYGEPTTREVTGITSRGFDPFPNALERVSRGVYAVTAGAFEPQTQDERIQGLPEEALQEEALDPRVDDSLLHHVRKGSGIDPETVHDRTLSRVISRALELLKV